MRAAPGYDPWTWLLWGREVAGGSLSTVAGPAFKPLPVAVCALLAPLGSAAPVLWVVLVRAAAGTALVLAYHLARTLDPPRPGLTPSRVGGGLAVAGIALAGGFALEAARGGEAPLVIAGALGAIACWRAGRLRAALALGAACALLRVEAWPLEALAGAVAWRRDPGARALLAALALVVPAAWFVPEWLGSGDVLRSGARARIPNPGQPALADVPALASLRAAAGLLLVPLWLGAALALREPRGARARGGRRGVGRARGGDGAGRLLAASRATRCRAWRCSRWRAPPALARAAAAGEDDGSSGSAAADRGGRRGGRLAAVPAVAELPRVRSAQAHQWALAARPRRRGARGRRARGGARLRAALRRAPTAGR